MSKKIYKPVIDGAQPELGAIIPVPATAETGYVRYGKVVEINMGIKRNMYRLEFKGRKGSYSECFYYERKGEVLCSD